MTPSVSKRGYSGSVFAGLGHPSLFLKSILVLAYLGLIPLTACRPHDFPQYPANYREYVYVTNSGSGTVSIYDVVNVRLDRELPVGQDPVAVAASPKRNEVYVVNKGSAGGSGSVSIIDSEHNRVVSTIPVSGQPVALALNPDGTRAYVANSASNSVSVLDLKTRREIAILGAGQEPVALRVSPDNKTLAVANRKSNSVSLLDPTTGMLRALFSGCPGAGDITILPDSSKAFVACSDGHQVMAIALARPDAHPAEPDRVEALLDVGRQPAQVALKPDGGEIFVLNSLSDSISEVITGTDDVLGAYLMGDHPVRGLVSADNALLYVCNLQSQYVTVYSILDGRRVGGIHGGIHVGDGPSAMAFSNAGNLLFVVDSRSGDVAVVRTALPSLFTFLPAGRAPNAIADKAFKVS